MEKAMRRIVRDKRRPLSARVRWSGVIIVLVIFATANAQMVAYHVPTNDWIRRVEKEQEAQQQMHHEVAVSAYRQARLRQMEEPDYQMCPIQPRPARYRLVQHPAPRSERFVQNQGQWSPPAAPPGPQPLTPPNRSEELMRQREELAQRAQNMEAQMRQLHENTERRQEELDRQLRDIHNQIAGVDEELAELERQRRERQQRLMAEADDQSQRLAEQTQILQNQTHQLRETLDEMRRQDGEPSVVVAPPRGERPRATPYQPAPQNSRAEDEATRQFREELRRELQELRGANEYTNEMLERLLYQDNPSTVGSAW